MKTWIFLFLLVGLGGVSAVRAQDDAATTGAQSAVIELARQYEDAFNKGDATALGALFTEDVEYMDEDGVVIGGREAVTDLLRQGFVRNPGATMEIEIESVRTLAPDVAVERGQTLVTSKEGEQTRSAYTAVHVRQNGTWEISQLIDSPVPLASPAEMLSELAWMVGTWNETDGDAQIETAVNWADGGNFLTRNFKVTVAGDVTLQGWQIIGWDAADEIIRSWLFDTEGAFQEGTWVSFGDGWRIRQSGVLPDGGTVASESTLRRAGEDKCMWESINRTLDGDPLPNLPPIEMNRVEKISSAR